jgi:hypothetical protein
MEIKEHTLRTDLEDYFKHVSYGDDRQYTPFVRVSAKGVEGFYKLSDLLQAGKDKDIILQTWVGKWRSDVFAFRFKDIKDYFIKRLPELREERHSFYLKIFMYLPE